MQNNNRLLLQEEFSERLLRLLFMWQYGHGFAAAQASEPKGITNCNHVLTYIFPKRPINSLHVLIFFSHIYEVFS